MDKQFLFFLFQNIFVGICELVDTGFGNHINMDTVCVLSAFTVITWTVGVIYKMGCYAYQVVLDKAKICFYIQLFVSIILGVFLYLTSSVIPYIYSLTVTQYSLFEQSLKVYAFSCPIMGIKDFLSNYAEYQCKNHCAMIGNIILYSSMLITDAWVILNHGGLTQLLWFTVFCTFIYSVYMFVSTGFKDEPFIYNKNDITILMKHAWNACFDKITGKIATIFFNIFASKLGTELYSIHAVCYAVGIFTEKFTNALFSYQVVVLNKKSDRQTKYTHCISITKKYAFFICFFSYVLSYILLLFTHGAVDIGKCIIYTGLYCSEVFSLLLYETMHAYLTSEHKTGYLKFGGLFGIFIRIPIAMTGYYCNLGLFSFAIASALDFLGRGIYFYHMCKKTNKLIAL